MKVTIDIECTPEDARTFLGLPDVQPMQRALLDQLQDRMSKNLAKMDPESMLRTWLPAGMQNLEQIQRFFWNQVSGAMRSASSASSSSRNTGEDGDSSGNSK